MNAAPIFPEVDGPTVRKFIEIVHDAATAACFGIDRPGLLQLARLHPSEEKMQSFRFPIGAVDAMVDQAMADASAGYNVYVEGRTVAENTPPGKRGDHTHTRAVFALVADDDGDKGMASIDKIKPSLIVQSSPGNSHRWYFLARALAHADAAAIGEGMKAAMGGDHDTGVPSQPYRVAGTPNFPSEKKRARGRVNIEPTAIIDHFGRAYEPDELIAAFPRPERAHLEPTSSYDGPSRDIDELLATCDPWRRDQLEETAAQMAARGVDRSKAFMPVVGWLRGDGFSLDEAVKLFSAFPQSGHMDKYASRIETETARLWGKVEDRPNLGPAPSSSTAERKIRVVSAASLATWPPPPREWHVDDMIPAGTVTSLYGDGGTGKSLLALQLAVSTAAGKAWIGRPVMRGACVFLTAEDDLDEVHRRLADICRAEEINIASLGNLHIIPLAGEDAVLAAPEGKAGIIRATALFRALEGVLAGSPTRLIVLDTAADLFAGNEVDRAQVRQFIGLLRGLAIHHDTTVLLLAHPSVAGMASGTGLSGSTAWNGSVRSRLYLRRDQRREDERLVETNPDIRILSIAKANYGPVGNEVTVRWQDGIFMLEGFSGSDAAGMISGAMEVKLKADSVFRSLLSSFLASGRNVSASPSSTYAPLVFSRHENSQGVSKRALTDAMNRLFERGEIENEEFGPPSTRRSRLIFKRQDSDAA